MSPQGLSTAGPEHRRAETPAQLGFDLFRGHHLELLYLGLLLVQADAAARQLAAKRIPPKGLVLLHMVGGHKKSGLKAELVQHLERQHVVEIPVVKRDRKV